LYLRFFEDKTQTEIAAEVGVSQMHVSRLLSQSLEQLRKAAGGGEPDSDDEIDAHAS
jgi:RNA polymerase sigma-B factor